MYSVMAFLFLVFGVWCTLLYAKREYLKNPKRFKMGEDLGVILVLGTIASIIGAVVWPIAIAIAVIAGVGYSIWYATSRWLAKQDV